MDRRPTLDVVEMVMHARLPRVTKDRCSAAVLKLVLMTLVFYEGRSINNRDIARLAAIGDDAVKRAISGLVEIGLITRHPLRQGLHQGVKWSARSYQLSRAGLAAMPRERPRDYQAIDGAAREKKRLAVDLYLADMPMRQMAEVLGYKDPWSAVRLARAGLAEGDGEVAAGRRPAREVAKWQSGGGSAANGQIPNCQMAK